MIKKETIVPQPRSYEKILETVCDICKVLVRHEVDDFYGSWSADDREINNVTMRHRKGFSYDYPSEISITETIFDICPDCWSRHVLPFMKSLGVEPRQEKKDC